MTDPLFICGLKSLSAILISRDGSEMQRLATLREAHRVKSFRRRGTWSLVRLA